MTKVWSEILLGCFRCTPAEASGHVEAVESYQMPWALRIEAEGMGGGLRIRAEAEAFGEHADGELLADEEDVGRRGWIGEAAEAMAAPLRALGERLIPAGAVERWEGHLEALEGDQLRRRALWIRQERRRR